MSSSFQAWLQQVTQPYYNPNHVAGEVDSTLRIYHSLRPQSSIYTLADGRQQSLLNLVGTLPVASLQNSGRVIDVPVEICLPLNYPLELPIIWIRPEMLGAGGSVVVRPTEIVDGNGTVWGLTNMRLVDLIGQLQSAFSHQLPIVSAVPQEHEQEYLGIVRNGSRNETRDYSASSSREYSTSSAREYNASITNVTDNVNQLKEKVSKELEGKMRGFEEESTKIQKMNSAFLEGESILKREKMTLNNEINLLLKEIDCVEAKRGEIERFITNNTDNTSIVSATVPSDPASSQLLELLANESALMDALYALIKVTVTPAANGESRLPLTASLRAIRELSRKHFLTKAHIRKTIK